MKIKKLTKRQKEILDYIQDYIIENNYSPTIQEISKTFQISDTSAAHHILSLEKKKKIYRTPGVARSIVVEKFRVKKLPLFKFEDYLSNKAETTICIPELLLEDYDAFCLELGDDRLIGAGMSEGDIIIIGETDNLKIGDFALVKSEDRLIIGQFFCEDEHIRLEPNNPMYAPVILYPKKEKIQIIGKFLALYRRF